MSDVFGGLYTVPAGSPQDPNLPPIDLPQVDAPPRRQPLRVTVGAPNSDRAAAGVWGSMPEYEPPKVPRPTPDEAPHPAGVWGSMPEYDPETNAKPRREVSTGEAFGREAAHSATFGLSPAIAGAISAGRSPEEDQASAEGYQSGHWPSAASELGSLITGLGKLGLDHLVPDVVHRASERYSRGRQEAQSTLEAGREQHGTAALLGGVAGSVMTPVPGLGAAGLGGRIARGALAGGVGGGLYGAGSALSEGKDLGDIGRAGLVEGAIGGVTGGLLHGAIGQRAPRAPVTPGERAAATAFGLDAPIPRALASDNRYVHDLTARARSLPLLGSFIGHAVDKTQEAAGKRIGGIAEGMVGATPSRAVSDSLVRPALQGVIDDNKAAINAAYDGVRGAIDRKAKFSMTRTKAAIQKVIDERAASGDENPRQGLTELINVSRGSTFEGAHMRRHLARGEGGKANPHPGYEKGAFNYIVKAMGEDLRDMVAAATKIKPPNPHGSQTTVTINGRTRTTGTPPVPSAAEQRAAAVRAFEEAEGQFEHLHDQNDVVSDLLKSQGHVPLERLMSAAKEKGGDVPLLNRLKAVMSPQDFSTIGGQILNELGHNNATGKFSLNQFVTGWDKLSPEAKNAMFATTKHQRDIEAIAGLGSHIKGALRESNTSHTAGAVILFEIAQHIVSAIASGEAAHLVSGHAMAGYGAAGAGVLFSHWLASPAKASSIAAWVRARKNLQASPTPARQGVFNIATRNLAHTLGIPVESIIKQHQEATDGQ